MEFNPITINSQEEYDSLVKERVDRAKRSEAAKYEGYDDYKAKAEKYDADIKAKNEEIASLTSKVKQYESNSVKAKVLSEFGLSPDLKDWITGDDEEAIKANAQKLQQIIGVQKTQPLADPEAEDVETDDERAALKKTIKKIRKG